MNNNSNKSNDLVLGLHNAPRPCLIHRIKGDWITNSINLMFDKRIALELAIQSNPIYRDNPFTPSTVNSTSPMILLIPSVGIII